MLLRVVWWTFTDVSEVLATSKTSVIFPPDYTGQQPRRQSHSNESKAKSERKVVKGSLRKRCKTKMKPETVLYPNVELVMFLHQRRGFYICYSTISFPFKIGLCESPFSHKKSLSVLLSPTRYTFVLSHSQIFRPFTVKGI
jgi:hypothetical protein